MQEAAVAKAVEEAGEVPEDATAALLITGLKRPFTPNALAQVLAETGIVKGKEEGHVWARMVSCQPGNRNVGEDGSKMRTGSHTNRGDVACALSSTAFICSQCC